MRTAATQLPTYEELSSILEHEAKREVPKEKRAVHFANFSSITNLLEAYALPTSFFEEEVTLGDLKEGGRFSEIEKVYELLTEKIVAAPHQPDKRALLDDIYDYLSETDELAQADIIFVFGSKKAFRIEKAIRLYKEGYAPMIIISGNGPFYERDKNQVPEAERLATFARKAGIPDSALILETESITVPDNVKQSLNLLEQQQLPHKKIILVNSPFSQRRGWAHFNKFSKDGTDLIRSNIDTVSGQFSREGWYESEEGVRVVIKEFFALRISVLLNTA